MKKLVAAVAIVSFSFFNVKAQNNYVLTKAGEKVIIMDDWLKLDFDYIAVHIENKQKKNGFESVVYKDKNLKMFEFGGRVFMVLPDKKNIYIQEIVCFNDKYILTSEFRGGSQYFVKVFDWNFNSVSNLKPLNVGKKNQRRDLEVLIKPYFGDCTNVIDMMDKNISNEHSAGVYSTGEIMTENIYAVKCNNTSKSINDLVKAFMALPEPTKK